MESLTLESPTSNLPACEPSASSTTRLVGEVRAVSALSADEREQMYVLMDRHFLAMSREGFAADLAEKRSLILIYAATSRQLVGFSTLTRIDSCDEAGPVCAFFSGDTIMDRAYWGSPLLAQIWARHVFDLAAQAGTPRVYWFLICSGYKTYRFLPLFFRTFYPTYTCPTPPEVARLIDRLAGAKFPHEYCPASGIVRLARPTPLRAEVAPLTAERQRDPHIAFFAEANPGHAEGDELVCLTELSHANLTPSGRRMLRRAK
jgi:hypothetical protein